MMTAVMPEYAQALRILCASVLSWTALQARRWDGLSLRLLLQAQNGHDKLQ